MYACQVTTAAVNSNDIDIDDNDDNKTVDVICIDTDNEHELSDDPNPNYLQSPSPSPPRYVKEREYKMNNINMQNIIESRPRLHSLNTFNSQFMPAMIQYICNNFALPAIAPIIERNKEIQRELYNTKQISTANKEITKRYARNATKEIEKKLRKFEENLQNNTTAMKELRDGGILNKIKEKIHKQTMTIDLMDDTYFESLRNECNSNGYSNAIDILKLIFESIVRCVCVVRIVHCSKYIHNLLAVLAKINMIQPINEMKVTRTTDTRMNITFQITAPNFALAHYRCFGIDLTNQKTSGFELKSVQLWICKNINFNLYAMVHCAKQHKYVLLHLEEGKAFHYNANHADQHQSFEWRLEGNKMLRLQHFKTICLFATRNDELALHQKDKHNAIKIADKKLVGAKNNNKNKRNNRNRNHINNVPISNDENRRGVSRTDLSVPHFRNSDRGRQGGYFGDGGRRRQHSRERNRNSNRDRDRNSNMNRNRNRNNRQNNRSRSRSRSRLNTNRNSNRDRDRNRNRDRPSYNPRRCH